MGHPNEKLVAKITKEAGKIFSSFGGGKAAKSNPFAEVLKDAPLMFAAGVDISAVVRLTLKMSDHDSLLEVCKKAAPFVSMCIDSSSNAGTVYKQCQKTITKANLL